MDFNTIIQSDDFTFTLLSVHEKPKRPRPAEGSFRAMTVGFETAIMICSGFLYKTGPETSLLLLVSSETVGKVTEGDQ